MDFVKGFAFLVLPLIAVLFVQDASAVPVAELHLGRSVATKREAMSRSSDVENG